MHSKSGYLLHVSELPHFHFRNNWKHECIIKKSALLFATLWYSCECFSSISVYDHFRVCACEKIPIDMENFCTRFPFFPAVLCWLVGCFIKKKHNANVTVCMFLCPSAKWMKIAVLKHFVNWVNYGNTCFVPCRSTLVDPLLPNTHTHNILTMHLPHSFIHSFGLFCSSLSSSLQLLWWARQPCKL